MGYGIMNKDSKRWINIINMGRDDLPLYKMSSNDTPGLWFQSATDAREFMKQNFMKDSTFKVVEYGIDYRRNFFEKSRHALLQMGWYESGNHVFRPNGDIYY